MTISITHFNFLATRIQVTWSWPQAKCVKILCSTNHSAIRVDSLASGKRDQVTVAIVIAP